MDEERRVKIDSQVQQFTKKQKKNMLIMCYKNTKKCENDELNERSRAVKQHCRFKIAIGGIIS